MTPTTGKRSIFASNKNGDRPISEEAKKNRWSELGLPISSGYLFDPLPSPKGKRTKNGSLSLSSNPREKNISSVGERPAARGWTTIPDERADRMGLLDVE